MGKTYLKNKKQLKNLNSVGFTIVELLVVIVVIGILAAITIVSYSGITQRAKTTALQSDLTGAKTTLQLYQAEHGSYPTGINATTGCPSAPTVDDKYCLKASSGNTLSYSKSNGTTFGLTETDSNGTTKYYVTDSTSAVAGADSWANWYPGIAGTTLAGKHVYPTDLVGTYQYETSYTAVAAPQGATGLDPNYPSNWSLVNPQAQANSAVDFSAYPAQNACKAIGGRLPNVQELNAIYTAIHTDSTVYGGHASFQALNYWSSTQHSISDYAYVVGFSGGGAFGGDKTGGGYNVRCVSG